MRVRAKFWMDLRRTDQASIVLEMALIAPVFIMLVMAICDFGLALRLKTQVGNAARTGAEYVAVHGFNQAGAQAASKSATGLSVTASATSYYGCPTRTGIAVQAANTTCTAYGSSPAGNYASVHTSAIYHPLLQTLWTTNSVSFSSTAVTRF